METFSPGDRVVAVNIDIGTIPLKSLAPHDANRFLLPDGPLRSDMVYHVERVSRTRDGCQGVYLTGLRVMWGPKNVPWSATRFRRVDTHAHHPPYKRSHKQPVSAALPATC